MKDISRLRASVTRAQSKLDKLIAADQSAMNALEKIAHEEKTIKARESLKRAQDNLTEHATQARLPMFDSIPTKAQLEGASRDYTAK